MIALLLGLALAAEPTSTMASDGTITIQLTVDATPDQLQAVLAPVDGIKSSDVYEITVVGNEGDCQLVRRKTRGMWRPLVFTSKRCKTASGYRETLTEKGDFTVYESEWVLSGQGAQTQVTYTIRTEVNIPAPTAMVRKGTEAGARAAVVQLAKAATQ